MHFLHFVSFFRYSGFSVPNNNKITAKMFLLEHLYLLSPQSEKNSKYWLFSMLKVTFLQNCMVQFFHQGLSRQSLTRTWHISTFKFNFFFNTTCFIPPGTSSINSFLLEENFGKNQQFFFCASESWQAENVNIYSIRFSNSF